MSAARGYPYSKDPSSGFRGAGQASTSQMSQSTGPSMRGLSAGSAPFRQWYDVLQRTLHEMKGAKQLWEIAVKRNSLATSLVLLSSVLVIDSVMVDQSRLKHFSFRAHPPLREQSNSQRSTAARNEGQQPQESHDHNHMHGSSLVRPAHAH